MSYRSETDKFRPRIQKYLILPDIIDIGCGHDKVTPTSFGVDIRTDINIDLLIKPNEIYQLSTVYPHLKNKFDVVYSSHSLEHLLEDAGALNSWKELLKPNGFIILYIPDSLLYNNVGNHEHVQAYTFKSFLRNIFPYVSNLEVVETFPPLPGDYSFGFVFKLI